MTYRAVLFATAMIVCGASQAQQAADVPSAVTALEPLLQRGDIVAPPMTNGFSAAPFAPAPPLTRIIVYAVGSSNCGWEYPSAGQLSTSCDHGGAQLRTAVLEIGYGGNPFVSMNGGQLPGSAQIGHTSVCITGNQYTWPCTAGQTVAGWLNEYNLDGQQSGTFKYQNTSLNSPWNTIVTQINIR
ncbi:MAG: hypothetical protein GAK28_04419 [Luteibacter sp.]|uniref:DUF4879 domain-containing protein n=1 Tax=Luteibacter sp. TaxID=1886636 RepID=UPI00137F9B6D|nr:DUF4879 domain-containing protein [Luteibacter sp.]KAF1003765.1 MAG: hypothetical protein GAK28_04419 [Luteibacter sp.]